MDEQEQRSTVDAGKADLPGSGKSTGLPDTSERPDLHPTTDEGPANPSDEAEDRNKSPEGGRDFNDDEVAIDPDNAPSANFFMAQITVSMLVVVVLLVVAALLGSMVLGAIAFLAILVGLGFNLFSIFRMMSTD